MLFKETAYVLIISKKKGDMMRKSEIKEFFEKGIADMQQQADWKNGTDPTKIIKSYMHTGWFKKICCLCLRKQSLVWKVIKTDLTVGKELTKHVCLLCETNEKVLSILFNITDEPTYKTLIDARKIESKKIRGITKNKGGVK